MYEVGITWGVFDLFHQGHLNLLHRASEQCRRLYVCVSTDEYVMKTKGLSPVVPFDSRSNIVHAIRYVHKVYPQSDTFSKQDAVNYISPDVIFVGSDWQHKNWDGSQLMLGDGKVVPVVYIPYTVGVSSTDLRRKLQQRNAALLQAHPPLVEA